MVHSRVAFAGFYEPFLFLMDGYSNNLIAHYYALQADFFCMYFWLGPKSTKNPRQARSSAALPCLRLPMCRGVLVYFLFSGVMLPFRSFTAVWLR